MPTSLSSRPALGHTAIRPAWQSLPEPVRHAVAEQLPAPIAFVANLGGGFTPGFAARLRLADGTAVTRLGEDGWSASMLMTLSGHRNLRTSASTSNAVAAALAEHDPGWRHH